jgi:prevent-host-death family protein
MADMTVVGIREFRNNLGRYFEMVKAGEAISITSHGKPIGELRPPAQPQRPFQRRIGGLKGKMWMADDWDEWDEDTLAAFEAPLDPENPVR